tara:strand:+ start:504 stop:1289 length:786 start_codon:yes stop_codon:yes gene_type:complete
MKEFFVIGEKTSNSLSPTIFNHWFKKYNIRARYSYVEVQNKNFNKAIKQKFCDKSVFGFNVTIPYKKLIIKHLDNQTKHSIKIGAVNCVTVRRKKTGTNTDWKGYLSSIKAEKIGRNKNIVILGYGGAAQAIFYGLTLSGYKNIMVFNRSRKKINFNTAKKYTKKYHLIDKYLMRADLIINTTPTNPLKNKQEKLVMKKAVISDIVYKPKNTIFLKKFPDNKKIFGISMLVEQAIPCFRLWFGFEPGVDKGLIEKLNKKIK